MGTRVTDLRCKEVINVTDGLRLGFVSDVEILLPEGKVLALVVPGPCRFFGLFGRKDDFVIPWNCIRRIGSDIILVELEPDKCRVPPAQAGLVLKEAAGGAWMINRPGFGRSPPTGRADRENPWGLWNEGRTDVNKITASRLQRLAVISSLLYRSRPGGPAR